MSINRIAHPETSPLDIPDPVITHEHPGIERPEILPPDVMPEQEPLITGKIC
jgi:hypothetical protein